MTNGEKFKQTFGFSPHGCPVPTIICADNHANCRRCPFDKWWEKDYKKCCQLELSKVEEQIEGQIEITEILKDGND